MTGAETLDAAVGPRPAFRGPLDNQRPAVTRTVGPDPWLAVAVAALVGLGMVMVFNIGWFPGGEKLGDPLHFARKHMVSVVIGLVLCLAAAQVPPALYRTYAYPMFGLALAGLVLVLVPGLGSRINGAQRWIAFGPLGFQPTEFAKPMFVIFLAALLAKKGARVRELGFGVLPACAATGVLAVLCLAEPDFGTAALSSIILVAMLFAGGARVRHLALIGSAGVPALAALAILSPYRLKRLVAFVDCERDALGDGFQLCQSLIAFGSGGWTGVGLGQGQQKMFYLPAAHTDFIFSVIGEELGLLGAVAVLGLFAVVAVRGFRIAARHPDPFAALLAFGLTSLIVVQALLNVGVALGALPTKGLTLPFVSYGGSAMMIGLAELGMLLALAREAG